MDDNFVRKFEIRKEAYKNSGKEHGAELDNPNGHNDAMELYDLFDDNFFDADSSHILERNMVINCENTFISRLKRFFKKIIRKLVNIFMGWYIESLLSKQNNYNGKIMNCLSTIRDITILHEEKIKNLNCNKECLDLIENMQNQIIQSNEIIEDLKNQMENSNKMVIDLKKQLKDLDELNNYFKSKMNISCDLKLLNYQMDYTDFENRFRGSYQDIKDSQKYYLNFYPKGSLAPVIDIGFGRGEFLELATENDIYIRGVDSYKPSVETGKERGFEVLEGDALTYLNQVEDDSLEGIFMGQVVEHLTNDYLEALILCAHKKLKKDRYFILETPNSETLSTYCNFYLDSGHAKPIHFLYLKYLFENIGYESVERYENEFSKYPYEVKPLDSENQIERENCQLLNTVLFGYRDYTLIAKK